MTKHGPMQRARPELMQDPLDSRRMSPEIDRLLRDLDALHVLGAAEIARVLPELERARARLWLMVMTPAVTPMAQVGEPIQELFTVKEVAAHLRFSPGHVYELIRSGRLRAIRDGRTIRVTREALAEWRAAHDVDQLDGILRDPGQSLLHDERRVYPDHLRLPSGRAPAHRGRSTMKRSR